MGNSETQEGVIKNIRLHSICQKGLDLYVIQTGIPVDQIISQCYQNRNNGTTAKLDWIFHVKHAIIVCEFRSVADPNNHWSEKTFTLHSDCDGESRRIFFDILTNLLSRAQVRSHHISCRGSRITHFYGD